MVQQIMYYFLVYLFFVFLGFYKFEVFSEKYGLQVVYKLFDFNEVMVVVGLSLFVLRICEYVCYFFGLEVQCWVVMCDVEWFGRILMYYLKLYYWVN